MARDPCTGCRATQFTLLLTGLLALAGCMLAPRYQVPPTPAPAAFKEAGQWTRSTPADELPRGEWWQLYADATLNELELRLAAQNPSLAAALARYDQSRAYLREVRAGQLPALNGNARLTRNRQSDDRPLRGSNQPDVYDDRAIGASVDYEFDLWGRIRNTVANGRYLSQARAADVESTRLSLQSQLAADYFELRGLDAQAKLLADTLEVYRRSLELTDARHEQGIVSGLDVEQARTQLQNARSELQEVGANRALLEHALAVLVGEPASTFTLPAAPAPARIPNVPAGLASTLLQRRPDIAAAERAVAAANAAIGIARAAFFPAVSLSALAGFQNTATPDLITSPNLYWTIGPQAVLNLFDAGRRRAQVAFAKARYRETVADYRTHVLHAFSDVEDNLALLNSLAEEADSKAAAVGSSEHAEALASALYRLGASGYLEVATAQTAALQTKLSAESVRTRRLVASVHLIEAIGGGWEADRLLGQNR
ncbi:MAG: efflux transporter outer membrane subunit [Proteobacteria bacterium]|nr:efflux transporter outer membrane subunit [Pseudomonadota bacterium]